MTRADVAGLAVLAASVALGAFGVAMVAKGERQQRTKGSE